MLLEKQPFDGRRRTRRDAVQQGGHSATGLAAEGRARVRQHLLVRLETLASVAVLGLHANVDEKLVEMLHREYTPTLTDTPACDTHCASGGGARVFRQCWPTIGGRPILYPVLWALLLSIVCLGAKRF